MDAHYSDAIMGAMASQISGVSIVYSTVCSGADHRRSASLALPYSSSRVSIHGATCCIMTSQVQHTAIYGSRAIRWTFSFICVLLRFHRRSSLKYDMVGSSDFCFLSYCAVYDGCKYSNTPRPKCRVCLCEHYTISFLSLCRLRSIRRHQTYT